MRTRSNKVFLSARTSSDSNYIVCPIYWPIRAARMDSINWSIVPAASISIVYMVAAKVVWLLWAAQAALSDGMTAQARNGARLGMIQGGCLALAGVCITGGTCRALALAAHRDGGLALLGIGTVKISLKAKRVLDCTAAFFTFTWFGMTLVSLTQIFAPLLDPDRTSFAADPVEPLLGWDAMSLCDWTGSGLFNLVSAFVGNFWAFALAAAATLAHDAVTEVIKAVDVVETADKRMWHQRVELPTIRLAEETMHHLSTVFETGLVACFAGGWTGAIGSIAGFFGAQALQTSGSSSSSPQVYIVYALFYFAIPFAVALPLASTSTRCDELMETLNLKRVRNLEDDSWNPDIECRMLALETALRQMNHSRGLGFTVTGTVIDKKMLYQSFVLVFSILATVVPAVLLLQPEKLATAQCKLTAVQEQTLQLMASTFDSECTYNITIGPGGVG